MQWKLCLLDITSEFKNIQSSIFLKDWKISFAQVCFLSLKYKYVKIRESTEEEKALSEQLLSAGIKIRSTL